eukprot:NODE_103_length_20051_cov_0.229401.p6 type:complete len:511 gc:universal NODE_103_length_20051_cov_0.229401:5164-6696(+)
MLQFIPFIFSVSMDCPNVIKLAKGMNLHVKQPSTMSAINTDCCGVGTGVVCTSGRVNKIDWSSKNLNGNFDGSLLTSMTMIDSLVFNYNLLTGGIPASYPLALKYLVLDNNKFNGSLPTSYPAQLTNFIVTNNDMTGSIPSNIRASNEISLSNNLFTGPIPVLPSGLVRFFAGGNQLTGKLPSFPTSLQVLYLGTSNNGNRLTGTIALNKPTELYAVGNYITDVIITDKTALTSCDLSDNPLLGSPHISALTTCTMTGIYYTTTVQLLQSTSAVLSKYLTITSSLFTSGSYLTTSASILPSISKTSSAPLTSDTVVTGSYSSMMSNLETPLTSNVAFSSGQNHDSISAASLSHFQNRSQEKHSSSMNVVEISSQSITSVPASSVNSPHTLSLLELISSKFQTSTESLVLLENDHISLKTNSINSLRDTIKTSYLSHQARTYSAITYENEAPISSGIKFSNTYRSQILKIVLHSLLNSMVFIYIAQNIPLKRYFKTHERRIPKNRNVLSSL